MRKTMSLSVSTSGVLFLVVGPSGAGKDTLIDAARCQFKSDWNYYFPKRVITRSGGIGEQHVVISDREFRRCVDREHFFLHWRAHGLSYGISADVTCNLNAGQNIVVNVSRTVVGEANRRWPKVCVIKITSDREALAERIAKRGRETLAQIAERLSRTVDETGEGISVVEVDNSGCIHKTFFSQKSDQRVPPLSA